MKCTLRALATIFLVINLWSCGKHQKRETKYPDGKPKEIFEVLETGDGSFIKDGEYKAWYLGEKKAIEGVFKQGKKEGNWNEWFPSGQTSIKSVYKSDSLNGPYHSWYENGQNKVQTQYENGKMVGHIQSWFENGQMEFDFTVDGTAKYLGNARQWYANGKIKKDANYDDKGAKNGSHKYWYVNGQQISEETYIDNTLNGTQYFWDDKGSLIVQREFRNGVDINLPASYKRTTGEKLDLKNDGTYELYYQAPIYFGSGLWKTIKGEFGVEVIGGEVRLILEDFLNNKLFKFNKDSIVYKKSVGSNVIFTRTK